MSITTIVRSISSAAGTLVEKLNPAAIDEKGLGKRLAAGLKEKILNKDTWATDGGRTRWVTSVPVSPHEERVLSSSSTILKRGLRLR